MKKITIAAAFALLTLPAWAQENGRPELATNEPPMLGLHMPRGAQPEARSNAGGGAGGGAILIYHGGQMATINPAVVQPIFWGPKWNNPSFFGDKISGLNNFYANVINTDYLKTNTEYKDSSNIPVSPAVTATASGYPDLSPTPSKAPSTSMVLARVCANITNPVSAGYYPVYTDIRRGTAGYCAWHSWGSCNGTPVQFGFFFDLDGDAGCDPRDSRTGAGSPSQGLAALVNVSGHELSEEMTDPRGTGMYDRQGYENSDKCAWDFGTPLIQIGSGQWKIQGNWSNDAYSKGYGYANEKGQKGCLDGGNYKLQPQP